MSATKKWPKPSTYTTMLVLQWVTLSTYKLMGELYSVKYISKK